MHARLTEFTGDEKYHNLMSGLIFIVTPLYTSSLSIVLQPPVVTNGTGTTNDGLQTPTAALGTFTCTDGNDPCSCTVSDPGRFEIKPSKLNKSGT